MTKTTTPPIPSRSGVDRPAFLIAVVRGMYVEAAAAVGDRRDFTQSVGRHHKIGNVIEIFVFAQKAYCFFVRRFKFVYIVVF